MFVRYRELSLSNVIKNKLGKIINNDMDLRNFYSVRGMHVLWMIIKGL